MASPDADVARNEYFDRQLNMQAVKLLPGEYHVSNQDMVQVTVLGSCVAACIRDKVFGIGGMNHFMLPDGGSDARHGNSSRYGVFAMEVLINEVLKRGARRGNLQAKLFGGGNVMKTLSKSTVGQRNADFAIKFLETEGIPIVASQLVDDYARKVYHFPATGKVRVKRLIEGKNDTIFEREREYGTRLQKVEEGGEIELFG